MRAFCTIRSSARFEDQPCSWVHREGRDREEEKKYLLAENAYKNCMLHFNIL
jgi:hypothetical protein